MRYSLYMYRPGRSFSDDRSIEEINGFLACRFLDPITENSDAGMIDKIIPFGAEKIKNSLEAELGNRCIVIIHHLQHNNVLTEYIWIVTSYLRAADIRTFLFAFAKENHLVLYDAETGKTSEDLSFDYALISLRIREQELLSHIREEITGLWKLRCIHRGVGSDGMYSCCSVTLLKDPSRSFLDRVNEFYECLKINACEREQLICEEKCFEVSYGLYSIGFVLEGYKKHADTVGFYEDGVAKKDLIRRMSIETAIKWIDNNCDKRERAAIQEQMDYPKLIEEIPNSSDRFVACLKTIKVKKK